MSVSRPWCKNSSKQSNANTLIYCHILKIIIKVEENIVIMECDALEIKLFLNGNEMRGKDYKSV